MAELPYRTLRAEDALAEMTHHLTQAAHHANKAHEAQRVYLSLLPGGDSSVLPGLPSNGSRRRSAPKCVTIWTEYLREHGPSFRQDIQDGTGMKFSERAYPYTIAWDDGMASAGDSEFMPDAIVRIRGLKETEGRGGAPVVFFLWEQRFDLFDRFGVGPRPQQAQALLGVIHPPTESQTFEISHNIENQDVVVALNDNPQPEVESTARFNTLDEWHEKWDTLFDVLVANDATPTDGEKEELLATMPEDTEGEPAGVILARTMQAARQRARA